jgi:hypothetical protein
MLHVNLFNTLDVTFISKAITTIYEANVQQLETEILKLRNNLILKAYSLCKNFWNAADYTISTAKKNFESKAK